MKKNFILSILFFLSSFLFFNSVSAADSTLTISNITSFRQGLSTIRSDMTSIRDTILTHYNYNSETQDYFCYFGTTSGTPSMARCWVFSNQLSDVHPYFVFNASNSTKTIYSSYFYFDNKSYSISVGNYSGSYSYYSTTPNMSSDSLFNTRQVYSSGNMSHTNDDYYTTSYNIDKWLWIDTTVPIYYGNLQATGVRYYIMNNLVITLNNEDITYTYNDIFLDPDLSFHEPTNPYESSVNNLGNNQWSATPNEITIDSTTSDNIICPTNTDFVNGFCYINQNNYSTDDAVIDDNLKLLFNFNGLVPLQSDHYYMLTYRFDSNYNLIPVNNNLVVSSGSVSNNAVIDNIRVINNGIYKDVQVIFHITASGVDWGLSRISLLLPYNSTISGLDPLNFYYGVYKSFKYTDFGTTLPTTQDLIQDYNDNSIDSISTYSTSWFNQFSVNTHGLSDIISSPIRLFQSLRNTTCSSVFLPLPYFGNIELPCIKSIFQQNMPDLLSLYQVIMSGIICYYVGINYFRLIKSAFTPDDDRIEVQDL